MQNNLSFRILSLCGMIFVVVMIVAMCSRCQSADKNITSKEINCNEVNEKNSMVCCLQFMSSSTGNDSKDAICRPLIDELRELLRENRKKELFAYCENKKDFQSCWDKLQSK